MTLCGWQFCVCVRVSRKLESAAFQASSLCQRRINLFKKFQSECFHQGPFPPRAKQWKAYMIPANNKKKRGVGRLNLHLTHACTSPRTHLMSSKFFFILPHVLRSSVCELPCVCAALMSVSVLFLGVCATVKGGDACQHAKYAGSYSSRAVLLFFLAILRVTIITWREIIAAVSPRTLTTGGKHQFSCWELYERA